MTEFITYARDLPAGAPAHDPTSPFLFLGNDRCLDFLNTLIADQGKLVDLLQSIGDLLRWFVEAEMLTTDSAADFARRWEGTVEAADALAEVRALRTRLIALVDGLIDGIAPPQETLAMLNGLLERRVRYEQIVAADDGAQTGWVIQERYALAEPRDLLAPLAHAAAMLLCERDVQRVRKCESPVCVLHYYDTSKNASRRWCDTRTCGNRMRVAQHYQRHHEHRSESDGAE